MNRNCEQRRISEQGSGSCWAHSVLNIFLLSDVGLLIMFWAYQHYKGHGTQCAKDLFDLFYMWLSTSPNEVIPRNERTEKSAALLRVIYKARPHKGTNPERETSYARRKKVVIGNSGGDSHRGAARLLAAMGFKEYGSGNRGQVGTYAIYDGTQSTWYGTADIDVIIQGKVEWTKEDFLKNARRGNFRKMYSRAEYALSAQIQKILSNLTGWLPPVPVTFRGYKIFGASIYIRSGISYHAIVGFECHGKRYIADSNYNKPPVLCDWLHIVKLNEALKVISAAYFESNARRGRNQTAYVFERYGAILYAKESFLRGKAEPTFANFRRLFNASQNRAPVGNARVTSARQGLLAQRRRGQVMGRIENNNGMIM
jgi:hypothetical protein